MKSLKEKINLDFGQMVNFDKMVKRIKKIKKLKN